MRPIPGASVKVSRQIGPRGQGSRPIFQSRAPGENSAEYTLLKDGTLVVEARTDEHGVYALEGVADSSVEATATWGKVTVSQAFSSDKEAEIVLPR